MGRTSTSGAVGMTTYTLQDRLAGRVPEKVQLGRALGPSCSHLLLLSQHAAQTPTSSCLLNVGGRLPAAQKAAGLLSRSSWPNPLHHHCRQPTCRTPMLICLIILPAWDSQVCYMPATHLCSMLAHVRQLSYQKHLQEANPWLSLHGCITCLTLLLLCYVAVRPGVCTTTWPSSAF